MDKKSKTRIGGRRQLTLKDQVLQQRYLRKDEHGEVIETPREMYWRVAKAVAAAEAKDKAKRPEIRQLAKRFYRLMAGGLFLPNSPTIMNAGRDNGMCLSACFVLPVPDSIDGIFEAVKQTAQVQKAGGGTGFSFDPLRPTGDFVMSSGGRTSGPISFMQVFSQATSAIQQGAFRRGANMAMMSVEHPDILKFVTAKNEPGAFENFNFSVKVTDDFMRALNDRPNEPHVVINPRTGRRYLIPKDVDIATYTIDELPEAGHVGFPCFTIGEIWWMIVRGAHATGEPGVCFIDTVNRDSPTPHVGRIEATNPCGEQPLLARESCNLGSINIARFVRADGTVDWDRLQETIKLAVRFLDNVIDINCYPIEEIEQATLRTRKIGLGLMGFADAMIKQGIRYDSEAAVKFASKVSRFLTDTAHEASEELARTRGTFPAWEGSTWETEFECLMRNGAVTTIAPTGSISIQAGCSSGIEPVFSFVIKRRALDGGEFVEIHPLLEELGQQQGWMTDEVRAALLEGSPPSEIPGFPKELADVFVTAHEVAPEWHVQIQAAFQANIDNAVSKTVNLPADATVEDVDKIFRQAYELDCKGITVYRDGSRQGQTLSTPGDTHEPIAATGRKPRPRSRTTCGQTSKFRMGCGTLFVTVNRDEHGLCEVFANLGKAGGCPSQSEATCRTVSAALRSGVDPAVLMEQLKGIRCLSASVAKKSSSDMDILSCPDAIARAIEESLGESIDAQPPAKQTSGRVCPFCEQPMRREAGCFVCDRCSFSSCG